MGRGGSDNNGGRRGASTESRSSRQVDDMEISFLARGDHPGPDVDFYDADPNRFLHGARLSASTCLLCLVKGQENA